MTILEISIYPNPILFTKTKEISPSDIRTDKIQKFVANMKETMLYHNGVGIAAPQVGIDKSIILYINDKNTVEVFINPVIIARIGWATSYKEGCISIPEVKKDIRRSKAVVVEGFNLQGDQISVHTTRKITSFILQHEIDHLNGITIMERKGKRRQF